MKANELMVGNFILSPSGKITKVFLVSEELFMVDRTSDPSQGKTLDDWNPIPITEEWLTKQGFKHEFDELCEFNYYIREIDGYFVDIQLECANMGEGYVTCHIDNCDRCTVASADIQYVHQLQNLLNIMNIQFDVEL
jgi:hypothetical protein